jgi:hypothetical protein
MRTSNAMSCASLWHKSHNHGHLPVVLVVSSFIGALLMLPQPVTTTTAAAAAGGAHNETGGVTPPNRLWRSWHNAATHLLPAVETQVTTAAEEKLVAEIVMLSNTLRREERELERLIQVRTDLKSQSGTWFLDSNIRNQVDVATLQMNNQRRKVESIFDDITIHWRRLKPLHGVVSKMFLSELLAFLLSPILTILDTVVGVVSFGLLFLFLLLGPVALFFITLALSVGLAMIPIIFSGLVILWAIEFPWMIIQYNPSGVEFILAYTPFLLVLAWLTNRVRRTLHPRNMHHRNTVARHSRSEGGKRD